MQRPESVSPATAVAIHDVSPATWAECRQLLSMLDDIGARPVSLLVIPNYHYRAAVLRDRVFRQALEARLAHGDELVLHGCFHVDDAPPPRTLRDWFERRMLTRAEGEFAALSESAAAWRIARGVAMFETLRWPLHGFVPPAWLMSAGTRAALERCGYPFEYVTVRGGMYHLPQWRFERTANLCYSPCTAPRRAFSAWAISSELRRAHATPLLRISLHPQDVRVPGVLRHWRRLIGDALAQRPAVTKRAWADRFRDPGARPAQAGFEGRFADAASLEMAAPAAS